MWGLKHAEWLLLLSERELIVIEAQLNSEEKMESKVQYKMQRLEDLRFGADALIQADLGELAVRLF